MKAWIIPGHSFWGIVWVSLWRWMAAGGDTELSAEDRGVLKTSKWRNNLWLFHITNLTLQVIQKNIQLFKMLSPYLRTSNFHRKESSQEMMCFCYVWFFFSWKYADSNQNIPSRMTGDRKEVKQVQREVKERSQQGKDSYRRKPKQNLRQNNVKDVWSGMRSITGYKQTGSQKTRGELDWTPQGSKIIKIPQLQIRGFHMKTEVSAWRVQRHTVDNVWQRCLIIVDMPAHSKMSYSLYCVKWLVQFFFNKRHLVSGIRSLVKMVLMRTQTPRCYFCPSRLIWYGHQYTPSSHYCDWEILSERSKNVFRLSIPNKSKCRVNNAALVSTMRWKQTIMISVYRPVQLEMPWTQFNLQ